MRISDYMFIGIHGHFWLPGSLIEWPLTLHMGDSPKEFSLPFRLPWVSLVEPRWLGQQFKSLNTWQQLPAEFLLVMKTGNGNGFWICWDENSGSWIFSGLIELLLTKAFKQTIFIFALMNSCSFNSLKVSFRAFSRVIFHLIFNSFRPVFASQR